jgi:hypothetical protein
MSSTTPLIEVFSCEEGSIEEPDIAGIETSPGRWAREYPLQQNNASTRRGRERTFMGQPANLNQERAKSGDRQRFRLGVAACQHTAFTYCAEDKMFGESAGCIWKTIGVLNIFRVQGN